VLRLDPASCTLLRDAQLVSRYNAVIDVLDEAIRELPRFADREVVGEVRGELSRLAGVMTKKRFSIGFIGPSQVGKSATVCNLLSVKEQDAPTPQGSGGPTTSVPTRTVAKQRAPGAENRIALHYFSRAEFLERVRDICDLVKIRFDDDLAQVREAASLKSQKDPHFKAADMEVLLKLIDAALAFPEVLEQESRVEQGTWEDRRIYATHQNSPSKYTLLREVCVEFVTDAVSPEVEMIDLPGIDVDKGSDARLTLAFVRDLDGAFMFQQSQQVKSAAITKLAERMREFHGRTLGERIWMVVTRCDLLNELQTQGPRDRDDQPTMFCHLAELMKQQGIKGDNVHFVGNAYYQERLEEGLAETQRASETLANRYPTVLRFQTDGRPFIPERCARNDGQIAPWEQFVLNGGIPALRQTMQSKVADSVREQTRREVTRRLVSAIDTLTGALQAAEQQSGMTVEEMMRAARWSGELDRMAEEIGRVPKYSHDAAEAITTTLCELIGSWGTPSRGRLDENHKNLTGMLYNAGLHEANDQTSKVVTLVKTELEKRSQSQPPPKAAGLPTPVEHWTAVVASCLNQGKNADGQPFLAPIFDGIREDPNPVTAGGSQMGADDYVTVMQSKVGRVARVFASRLVHEMQRHLHYLQQRYRAIGSECDHIDADQRERYAKYRTALDRLRT
jgi:hypothetical protein